MWMSRHTVQEQNTATPHRKYELRRGVPAKTCVLSCLSRVSHSMTISLSRVLPSFALLPFSLKPTATTAQRRERAGWVSETFTTPLRYAHAHRYIVLVLGFSLYGIATLHSVWPQCQWGLTYCHMCTYCVFSFCLYLSHHLKHDRQQLPTDGESYYYSTNSLLSFRLRSGKKTLGCTFSLK